jgi:hypothetical protein
MASEKNAGDHVPDQRRKPDATRGQAKRKRRYESRGQGENQIEIEGASFLSGTSN